MTVKLDPGAERRPCDVAAKLFSISIPIATPPTTKGSSRLAYGSRRAISGVHYASDVEAGSARLQESGSALTKGVRDRAARVGRRQSVQSVS